MPSGRSKKTGSNRKGASLNKQGVRKKFRARHIDQVWQDVRNEKTVHDGKHGPLGTFDKTELDDDLPARGQHYCVPCSRYFISAEALATHEATKPHKRRCKVLAGDKPHSQRDAEWAAGMGEPDNGLPSYQF